MKKLLLLLAIPFAICTASVAQDKTKCAATTKAGEPCNRYAKKEDTKCYQHSDKAIRCSAETKSGSKCKLIVKEAGQLCHLHRDKKA